MLIPEIIITGVVVLILLAGFVLNLNKKPRHILEDNRKENIKPGSGEKNGKRI